MVLATALLTPYQGSSFVSTTIELADLQDDEVIVDMVASGICHTDLAVRDGKIPGFPFPGVLGHEGAGVVRNTGRAVKSIRLGDHVVLSYASCGDCRSCVTRKPYQCYTAQQQNFGGRRADRSSTIQGIIEDDHSPVSSQQVGCLMFGQSSFSSTTIARECSCVPVDKHLPLETICALGCGFQTGSGAVYNLVKPLQRAIRHVAIFGIGGVGCAAILAANQLRETAKANFSIVAIDIHGNRLELARELGATETINSSTDDLVARVQTITKGEGFDAAIDCTGVIPVVKNMVSVVGVGGIAVQVGGPPPGKTVPIDAFDMLIKCKSYVGCHQGNAYSKEFIPWLADLYSKGHFPLEKLQKRYAAKDINLACEEMINGSVIKPVLIW